MTIEKIERSVALQEELESCGEFHTKELLVSLWKIAHSHGGWLAVVNALWQAHRISEELHLPQNAEVLADMAKLAEIRAEMEAT